MRKGRGACVSLRISRSRADRREEEDGASAFPSLSLATLQGTYQVRHDGMPSCVLAFCVRPLGALLLPIFRAASSSSFFPSPPRALARQGPSLPPVASVVVVGVTPRFCRFSPPSILAQGGFRHKMTTRIGHGVDRQHNFVTSIRERHRHRRRKMDQNKSYYTRLPPAHAPSRMNPKESCTRLWYPCWRTSQQQQKYLPRHCKEAEGV